MTVESSRRSVLLAGALAFVVPFVALVGGWRYLGSGDTVPAELLPLSILGDGDLAFDEFVHRGRQLPYWFQEVRGHALSSYPILPGLLNVPVYAVAGAFGVPLYEDRFRLSLITVALLTAGSVVFMHRCLLRVCASLLEANLFAFAYFFGTTVWSVAGKGLFQHGPSLFFLTLALLLLLRAGPSDTALAGLVLGFAVINRPTNLLIALPLAVFAVRERRRGIAGFFALAAVPALLHAVYAWRYFGTPFTSGQPIGLERFHGDWREGLGGLLLSPSRGLFVFSPFLLLAIPAAVACFRRGEPAFYRYLVVAVVLEVALHSKWDNWWGGHTFGYRLLIEIVPLLVLILARQWRRLARSPGVPAVFGALLGISVAVNALGAFVFPSGFNANIDLEPWRLWSVRDSELALDLRKLGRISSGEAWIPPETGPSRGVVRAAAPRPVWWTPGLDDDTIPAHLDWPREGSRVRGELVVAGWAGTAEGPVDVQVLLGPGDRVLAPERVPRPDVCGAFPRLKDCRAVGFLLRVPPPAAGPRQRALVVEVRDVARKVKRLGPVRFSWK